METSRRSGLVGGLILILVGGAFLAAQFVPGLRSWFRAEDSWPLIIVGVGFLMLVLALALGTPSAVLAGIAQAARRGVLIKGGARVVLCSHLGRPKGGPDPRYSLGLPMTQEARTSPASTGNPTRSDATAARPAIAPATETYPSL